MAWRGEGVIEVFPIVLELQFHRPHGDGAGLGMELHGDPVVAGAQRGAGNGFLAAQPAGVAKAHVALEGPHEPR